MHLADILQMSSFHALWVQYCFLDNCFRCKAVIQCSNFWTFATAVSDGEFPFTSLPASSKRQLYQALVYAGSPMIEQRQQYWEKVSYYTGTYITCPTWFNTDCHTSWKRSGIKSCPSINEGKIIPTKKFDWLAKCPWHSIWEQEVEEECKWENLSL